MVADAGNSRIQRFDSGGAFEAAWNGAEDGGAAFGTGLALDTLGADGVIVLSAGDDLLRVFGLSGAESTSMPSAQALSTLGGMVGTRYGKYVLANATDGDVSLLGVDGVVRRTLSGIGGDRLLALRQDADILRLLVADRGANIVRFIGLADDATDAAPAQIAQGLVDVLVAEDFTSAATMTLGSASERLQEMLATSGGGQLLAERMSALSNIEWLGGTDNVSKISATLSIPGETPREILMVLIRDPQDGRWKVRDM